jgi:peptide/nickel transport system substrate-binding protein
MRSQAYNMMLFWWQRIVVHNKRVKGWRLTPSHYLGNDLTRVWLDQ